MSATTTRTDEDRGGAPEPENLTEETSEAATEPERGWKGLIVQPIAIAVALGAWLVWRVTADLSTTELEQLGWTALGRSTWQHVQLTFLAAAIVLVIAIPLGVLLTRGPLRRFVAPVVVTIAGIGQAAPAIGLFVILASVAFLGFSFGTAVVTLVLYATLPVLRNTMVGIQAVDYRLIEAGRGMGMSALSVLLRVELPLAVPILLSGVRTALVLLVGTATLATFISGGGLGILITTGINLNLNAALFSGAILVALLALLIDWLGRVVEHVASPKGLR